MRLPCKKIRVTKQTSAHLHTKKKIEQNSDFWTEWAQLKGEVHLLQTGNNMAIKTAFIYLIAYSFCAYYCVKFTFLICLAFLTKAKSKFWKLKKRPYPPQCLLDKDLGNHKTAKVNVRDVTFKENPYRDSWDFKFFISYRWLCGKKQKNICKLQGITIHYVEKGDKSKPLMLFVHGFPEFWYSWRHQIKEFSKDYWVVVPDMRGYAESDKPKGVKNYKIDILVEDLRQLLNHLGNVNLESFIDLL